MLFTCKWKKVCKASRARFGVYIRAERQVEMDQAQEKASGCKQTQNTNKTILGKEFLPSLCLETLHENTSEIWTVGRKGLNICTNRHGNLGKVTSFERERGSLERGGGYPGRLLLMRNKEARSEEQE